MFPEIEKNDVVSENININTEVKMDTEKKLRKSKFEREIEDTKKLIENATDERRKKHYEEHLEILLEDKAAKEAADKVKKSDWMADYRIGKMSDDDIKRMYHRYHEEMLKRELPFD